MNIASPPKTSFAILLAVFITLMQVSVALSLNPQRSFSESYEKLYAWDSGWYASIMTEGYHSSIPPVKWQEKIANVAFFPGFPLWGRLLMFLTNAPPQIVLPLAAQLSAVGFWTYVLLLSGLGTGRYLQAALGVLIIGSFPTTFYLVAGYSESLFLASCLGFFYWGQKDGRTALVLAAIHGFVMTGTRIVGLPLVGLPILVAFIALGTTSSWRENWSFFATKIKKEFLVAVLAALGCIFFFIYCQLNFGMWNLYMETQRIGWGVIPDFAAPFSPDSYHFCTSASLIDANCLSRSSVPIALAVLILASIYSIWIQIWRLQRPIPLNINLLLAAWGSFFISIVGLAHSRFLSMIRYNLPVFTFVVLAVILLGPPMWATTAPSRWRRFGKVSFGLLVVALAILMMLLQVKFFSNYLSGHWVS